MNSLRQMLFIARTEARFFIQHPKLLLAMLAVALMPAVYTLIYLSSVWDPASRTGALPVALVNRDRGLEYREHVFNVGNELIDTLKQGAQFGYVDYQDEVTARQDVRRGKLAFALIIPSDFSSNAIPGTMDGAAKPVVFVSEGNNYDSAIIARQFAETLGRRLNQNLNEQRWSMVLSSADGVQGDITQLRAGVDKLNQGAKQLGKGAQETADGARGLAHGSRELSGGVAQLTGGFKQLSSGLHTLESKLPANSDLNRLRNGSRQLVAGQDAMGKGVAELHTGSLQLANGIGQFKQEAEDSLFVPAQVAEGAQKLADGAAQLENGLGTAQREQTKLAEGARQLDSGVRKLTQGLRTLNDNVRQVVGQLPAETQLDELNRGGQELAAGANKVAHATRDVATGSKMLALGLDQLARAIPASLPKPDGSPQGLAHSIDPVVEVTARAGNSGNGFAPNVLAAALWLGAGIAAFLLHVRVLPHEAQSFSCLPKVVGKIVIPAGIVLLQTLIIGAVAIFLLRLRVDNLPAFALVMAASAQTFLLIVFALTRAFGDAGKALAMILLALQLSSSGGILPVELSGSLFATLSPWLPLTWTVQALKASLFGAYDQAWQAALVHLLPWWLAMGLMACVLGRWRYVDLNSYRPAVDL